MDKTHENVQKSDEKQTLADICFTGGIVANVFSGEFVRGQDVIVVDGLVVDIAPQGTRKAKETIDFQGAYLIPGLIDSHVHIESSLLCPEHFSDLVVPHGTSVIVADPHEIANVLGTTGLDYMLKAAESTPLDIRYMLPSCVPATPFENAGAVLKARDLKPYLKHPKVLGLGEVMNISGLLAGDADLLEKIADVKATGKVIDGHAPKVTGAALSACAAAGIKSDHECSSLEEMQEHLAKGIVVNIREGSAAKNFDTLIKGVNRHNAWRCFFCTDDANPTDIQTRGHIDKHLKMSVAAGLDAMTAIRMATIYAARHYKIDQVGAIAPGFRADFFTVKNLTDFTVCDVYLKGEHVAHAGRMLASAATCYKPQAILSSVKTAPVTLQTFTMPVAGDRIHAIGLLPHQILTDNVTVTLNNPEGRFDAAKNPGLVKIAVIERHHGKPNRGLGVLKGYLKEHACMPGAIATTIAHDSHNVVVAGGDDADMLLAVETLREMGGGMVVVKNHRVIGQLALPVAGLMSFATAEEVIAAQSSLYGIAHEAFEFNVGVEPIMTLAFMALPVIPHLRVTDLGLFDVDRFDFIKTEA